jgi:hypothetical protein
LKNILYSPLAELPLNNGFLLPPPPPFAPPLRFNDALDEDADAATVLVEADDETCAICGKKGKLLWVHLSFLFFDDLRKNPLCMMFFASCVEADFATLLPWSMVGAPEVERLLMAVTNLGRQIGAPYRRVPNVHPVLLL